MTLFLTTGGEGLDKLVHNLSNAKVIDWDKTESIPYLWYEGIFLKSDLVIRTTFESIYASIGYNLADNETVELLGHPSEGSLLLYHVSQYK